MITASSEVHEPDFADRIHHWDIWILMYTKRL
jgi:hypothetical protein